MSIPQLTAQQIADLIEPIAGDASIAPRLSEWAEIATRKLLSYLAEPDDPAQVLRWSREGEDELKRIANDPARALDIPPETAGGKSARETLLAGLEFLAIDPETRKGAVVVGNLARRHLSAKPGRVDFTLTVGEDQLFDDLAECLREMAPAALDTLPNNVAIEGDGNWPAILFARAFVEIVVDRCLERPPQLPKRAGKRLTALLNKSDRRLLDGLRAERQFRQRHAWLDGDDINEVTLSRATIFD